MNKEMQGPSCLGGTFLRESAHLMPNLTLAEAPLHPFYFHELSVTVADMGASREAYQEAVAAALQEADLVLTYRLNVPGPWKKSPLLTWAFESLREDLHALLAFLADQPPYPVFLGERRIVTRGGDLGILLLQAPGGASPAPHPLHALDNPQASQGPSADRSGQVLAFATQIKQILQVWEESLYLDYLPDVDVYYREEVPKTSPEELASSSSVKPAQSSQKGGGGRPYIVRKLFRTALGAKPRPCFVCQDRTGACLRARQHSVALMEATIFSDLFALFLHSEEEGLAALATSALIQELALSPKPGLVSGADPGIHTDMDMEAMAHSISLFRPYFSFAVSLAGEGVASLLLELEGPVEARMPGFQDQGEAYSRLPYLMGQLPPDWSPKTQDSAYQEAFDRVLETCFQELRRQGLQVQRAMGLRTGGANTLFGQIFTMGLMVFAVAFLAALYMGRGRWAWDLLPDPYRSSQDLPSWTRSEPVEPTGTDQILRDLSALIALLSRPVRKDQLRSFFQNLKSYLNVSRFAPGKMPSEPSLHSPSVSGTRLDKERDSGIRSEEKSDSGQLPPAYEVLQEKLATLLTQEGPLCYKDLEKLYQEDLIRVLGARAGALYGLPTVIEIGLPSLLEAKAITKDRVTILSYCLLRLMAADGDTCALKRNPAYYFHLQQTLPGRLDDLLQEGKKEGREGAEAGASSGQTFEEGVRALMADLVAEALDQGYSPGGAADHLAQTIFARDALEHLTQIRALFRIPETIPESPYKGDVHA